MTTETSRNGSEPERTAGQKALAGMILRDREGVDPDEAAERSGSTIRQIQAVAAVLKRVPEFEGQLADGSMSLNAALTGSGYRTHYQIGGRAFGKGDKWPEVANAMMQFLNGWASRDFKFTHVPPKEAAYRIKVIDEMVADLQSVRNDLEQRAVRASLSLPSK